MVYNHFALFLCAYPAQPGNGLFRDIERKKRQEVAWLIGMAHQDSNLIYPSPVTMRSFYISGGEKRPSGFWNYFDPG